jgi:transcriptional regulator with XRE-family HTH domain
MQLSKGFGKRVQMARKDQNATQVAFARMALSGGASAKNIGRIEKEEVTPREETLKKIAKAAGVDINWLATGKTQLKGNCLVKTAGIGTRITQMRKARGLSLLALAEKSGLGQSSRNVSRLESGEVRPRLATLGRVASALGVPVEQLAYGA